MTAAEYIAKENTPGVVAFARKHGYQISNDPREAHEFLRQAWESDPEAVKAAMTELHPHANFMGGIGHVDQRSMSRLKKRYRNYDGNQYSEDTGESDIMDILERGIDKGRQMATNLFSSNNNPNQPAKDHTKEILTYGAVLLAGIFIGKFLMK